MTELDIEIARMSDIETKTALKRLITVLVNRISCAFEDETCPIEKFCKKNSRPCDLRWLDYAREAE